MSPNGANLGIDLNELYVVAHDLRQVVGDYEQAAKLVAAAEPPVVESPWTNIVMEWFYLRINVSSLLSDTGKNLTDTATALNKAANDYAATDQAAAAKFHYLQKQDQAQPGW
jgi:hypothetical protein